MQLSQPLSTVSPGLSGRVLTVLTRTNAPLTGRTVATLVRPPASQSGVQASLDDFVAGGLVLKEPAGRAYLYRLNHDHLAAGPVLALANLALTLLESMQGEVAAWQIQPVVLWMFGSTARGEASTGSDIDLLVMRPDDTDADHDLWATQLSTLSSRVYGWTGNACHVLELSAAELTVMADRGEQLVDELSRDAIALVGPPPRSMLRRKVTR